MSSSPPPRRNSSRIDDEAEHSFLSAGGSSWESFEGGGGGGTGPGGSSSTDRPGAGGVGSSGGGSTSRGAGREDRRKRFDTTTPTLIDEEEDDLDFAAAGVQIGFDLAAAGRAAANRESNSATTTATNTTNAAAAASTASAGRPGSSASLWDESNPNISSFSNAAASGTASNTNNAASNNNNNATAASPFDDRPPLAGGRASSTGPRMFLSPWKSPDSSNNNASSRALSPNLFRLTEDLRLILGDDDDDDDDVLVEIPAAGVEDADAEDWTGSYVFDTTRQGQQQPRSRRVVTRPSTATKPASRRRSSGQQQQQQQQSFAFPNAQHPKPRRQYEPWLIHDLGGGAAAAAAAADDPHRASPQLLEFRRNTPDFSTPAFYRPVASAPASSMSPAFGFGNFQPAVVFPHHLQQHDAQQQHPQQHPSQQQQIPQHPMMQQQQQQQQQQLPQILPNFPAQQQSMQMPSFQQFAPPSFQHFAPPQLQQQQHQHQQTMPSFQQPQPLPPGIFPPPSQQHHHPPRYTPSPSGGASTSSAHSKMHATAPTFVPRSATPQSQQHWQPQNWKSSGAGGGDWTPSTMTNTTVAMSPSPSQPPGFFPPPPSSTYPPPNAYGGGGTSYDHLRATMTPSPLWPDHMLYSSSAAGSGGANVASTTTTSASANPTPTPPMEVLAPSSTAPLYPTDATSTVATAASPRANMATPTPDVKPAPSTLSTAVAAAAAAAAGTSVSSTSSVVTSTSAGKKDPSRARKRSTKKKTKATGTMSTSGSGAAGTPPSTGPGANTTTLTSSSRSTTNTPTSWAGPTSSGGGATGSATTPRRKTSTADEEDTEDAEGKRAELEESATTRLAFKSFYKSFRNEERVSFESARELAYKALEDGSLPESIHYKVYLELADLAKRSNEYVEARRLYQKVCQLQPYASQGWLEYSKLEEECGFMNRVTNILHAGLDYCTYSESLLTRAVKHQERMGNLEAARIVLARLKHVGIEKVWRTVLEGALLEARAGNSDMARRVLKYLMHHVPWYGPLYLEAYKLERDQGHPDDALQVVQRGLEALPRYGPLWFGAFRLYEEIDIAERQFSLPKTMKMIERAKLSVSKELVWKVHLEAAQMLERTALMYLASNARRFMVPARQRLILTILTCPNNLRWKVWLAAARMELGVGNFDTARALVKRAHLVVQQKSRSSTLLDCARLEEFVGNTELARAILCKARVDYGSDWKVWLESVLLEIRHCNYTHALEIAGRALEIHTGTGRLWATLVQLQHIVGNDSAQKFALQRALLSVPKSGEVWCEGGRIHLNPFSPTFDLNRARRCLYFAAKFTPQFGDSFVELLRVEILSQWLQPIANFIWKRTKSSFLAPSGSGNLTKYVFDVSLAITIARSNGSAGSSNLPPTLYQDIVVPVRKKLRFESLRSAIDLTDIRLSYANADPNYGALWFLCRKLPTDTPRRVIENAAELVAEDLFKHAHIYLAAMVRRMAVLSTVGIQRPKLEGIETSDPEVIAWETIIDTNLRDATSLADMLNPVDPTTGLVFLESTSRGSTFVTGLVELSRPRLIKDMPLYERRRTVFGTDALLP